MSLQEVTSSKEPDRISRTEWHQGQTKCERTVGELVISYTSSGKCTIKLHATGYWIVPVMVLPRFDVFCDLLLKRKGIYLLNSSISFSLHTCVSPQAFTYFRYLRFVHGLLTFTCGFANAKTQQAVLRKLQLFLTDVDLLQPFFSHSSPKSQQKQN